MDDRRCTATSKRSGLRCKRAPLVGGTVCATHGGSAPQVKRAAAERIAALVDPALDALGELLSPLTRDDVRLGAIKDVLDRAGLSARQKHQLEHAGKLQVEVSYVDEAPH